MVKNVLKVKMTTALRVVTVVTTLKTGIWLYQNVSYDLWSMVSISKIPVVRLRFVIMVPLVPNHNIASTARCVGDIDDVIESRDTEASVFITSRDWWYLKMNKPGIIWIFFFEMYSMAFYD